MKATELRIGNYFEYKKHIIEFAIEDFTEISNNDQFLKLFLKPIKLTEQWFKDFGFKLIESSFLSFATYELNGVRIDKGTYIYVLFNDKEIKYVHQLQNFYFALTSKELKSNIKVIKL